jgi:hypothetical protein
MSAQRDERGLHRIVCACGLESTSGDTEHHMTSADFFECPKCGRSQREVHCPPGCVGVRVGARAVVR